MFLVVSSSFLFSIIPIFVICGGLYFISKKKQEEESKEKVFGRKGSKDHLWLVIKEYLKLENRTGLEIKRKFAFPRPDKKEVHNLIKKSKKMIKKNSSEKNKFFSNFFSFKDNEPERYDTEGYLDELEKETEILNKNFIEKENQVKSFKFHRKELIEKHNKVKKLIRRRYVIIFKLHNPHTGITENWEAIEVELFKNTNPNSALKDKLVINKKLNYLKELPWFLTLKNEHEKEYEKLEKKEQAKKIKKLKNEKNKNISFLSKIKKFKLWNKVDCQN